MTPKRQPEQSTEELYRTGLALMRRGRAKEALGALRQALDLSPQEARYRSQYGLCLATGGGKPREGVKLCRQAVEEEFFRPELYRNLGKALLATGRPQEAQKAFREGLTLDPKNRSIILALESMGVRQRPLFPFLDRSNPLNRWPGMVRHRLGGGATTAPQAS